MLLTYSSVSSISNNRNGRFNCVNVRITLHIDSVKRQWQKVIAGLHVDVDSSRTLRVTPSFPSKAGVLDLDGSEAA